jgi:exopolysaccharide biosynthesis polyprenyl glycosylphosphotransferase
MLKNRIEGLVSLQALWVACIVSAAFFAFVSFTEATRWVTLLPGFNQNLYLVSVLLGMLLAGRVYAAWSNRLLRLGWRDAFVLTSQQMARLGLVMFGLAFAIKDAAVSRAFLIGFLALAAGIVFVCNLWLPRWIARMVFGSRGVATVVVGNPSDRARLEAWMQEDENLGVDLIGFVTRDGSSGEEVLGALKQLPAILDRHGISQVVLPLYYLQPEELRHAIATVRDAGCRLRIVEIPGVGEPRTMVVDERTNAMVVTDGPEPLENPINRGFKRAFDIAFSLPVVLFVLPPLTAMVALMQRLQSPGPVFFRQIRYGSNRKPFLIYKFRTMHVAAQRPETEAVQAKRNDERIFRFGQFMRRTSIDEIPQFINVLLGEMSVAGPRPHLTQHDDQFEKIVSGYRMRHYVKPGITGLAQSEGFRGEIQDQSQLEERVLRDVSYVRHWSLQLDLVIVLRTIRAVFFPPKSAY